MGRILLHDLRVPCIVGTYPHEREQPQVILVSLAIELLADPACTSDRLADALDYEALANRLRRHAATTRFYLLERLAAELAQVVLEDPRVGQVTVRVGKPGAIPQARLVEFEYQLARA
jgi:dihydroneopterin aldolase